MSSPKPRPLEVYAAEADAQHQFDDTIIVRKLPEDVVFVRNEKGVLLELQPASRNAIHRVALDRFGKEHELPPWQPVVIMKTETGLRLLYFGLFGDDVPMDAESFADSNR